MSAPALPCPCCGQVMSPRRTHKGKPYYICDPCGVQLFIRTQEGIERLEQRTRAPAGFWSEEAR